MNPSTGGRFGNGLFAAACILVVALAAVRLFQSFPQRPPDRPSVGQGPSFRAELDLSEVRLLQTAAPKVVLIEFSDFECPYCGVYSRNTRERLIATFVETGLIAYGFHHLPTSKLHPNAFAAAVAAECAAADGRFWELHERLFRRQWQLDQPSLVMHARAVGLDIARFSSCLGSPGPSGVIESHLSTAARFGITSTPTFVIGTLQGAHAELKTQLRGAQDFSVFSESIESMLKTVR